MKTAILLFLLSPIVLFGQEYSDTEKLRALFSRASSSAASCDSLLQLSLIKNSTQHSAYSAAALIIQAKHLTSPLSKWMSFKEGKKQLDSIISKENNNIEIRWIRYHIQTNTPSFLNYNQHLEEDRLLIETHLLKNKHSQALLLGSNKNR